MGDCLKAALEYAGMGLRVFPVHVCRNNVCSCGKPNCTSPGKHPRTPNGVKDATSDAMTIKEWWKRWPDSNVAAALAESGLIDVECDSPEAEADYSILVGDDPPVCPVFQSHRGKHRLFGSRPDMPKIKQVGRVEVRGCSPNLYSLFPPSLHPSGDIYTWLVPLREFTAPPPPMPDVLLAAIVNLAGEDSLATGKQKRAPEHWKQGFKGTTPGGRTDFAISYIGKMLRELPSLEDKDLLQFVLDAALAINERNKPPLPVDKLTKDFQGILRREKQQRLHAEVAEAVGIELGELPEGFAFWKIRAEPPRYEWHAPIFAKAEDSRVVFTAEQFLSGIKVQRQVFEQADVFLTASFVKKWGKRTQQGKGGPWMPSIAERLVENMQYKEAPPEERRSDVVAELLLEQLGKARPLEQGQSPDGRGRPCLMPDGSVVFKFTHVWRELNYEADRVNRLELSRVLVRAGAVDYCCEGQRFKRLAPEALAAMRKDEDTRTARERA